MPFDSMRNLLGWRSPLLEASPPAVDLMPSRISDVALADDDDPIWPSARIGVAEALWGEGFLFPGGGEEVCGLRHRWACPRL